ncbi:MAG: methyltransferase family protein, partial [Ardenticatenaceae bacterium]
GNRGEGWVIGQFVLGALIFVAPPARVLETVGWLRPVGAVLFVVGALLSLLSAGNLGHNLTPFPKPIAEGQLVESGMYSIVRHPIYLGVLLAAFGWAFWRRSLIGIALSLLLFAFFDAKARHEERWLLEKYPRYSAYQKRVKKLIPWLY